MGAGALAYAGAAQEWNGKSETRVPKPTMSSAAMPCWEAAGMSALLAIMVGMS